MNAILQAAAESGSVTDFLVATAVLFSLPLVVLLLGRLFEQFF
ncbi:hypothetical protein [Haloferax sulfurifontis]|uniref:Uncharacterized protein n=1 Tax=Haloferax sulfurifontis TaxID=255616 RepID=A0A830DXF1_9EURY|nr:hypothetical protein [Haloferax sulfurifontis]GGC58353.1 hypothetical protein GCM10007209_20330 [Haloferax sulfurifontis]